MIQQQFEQLKNLRKGYVYKDFEVIDNNLIKKNFYRKRANKNSNAVVEECHEFYVNDSQIVEKIVTRECEIAIFSGRAFVLPEGCNFSEPIKQEYKAHDNAIELAFRFGIEFENSHGKLHAVKWSSLSEIVKQLEYILLQGEGYRTAIRRADTAFFSFQDEHYLVTHSSKGYTLHKRSSAAHVTGEAVSTYKTAMDLVLVVGIQKFQFGITGNGGH